MKTITWKIIALTMMCASSLMAAVSWDDYIFRIENGVATLKSGPNYLFVCDKCQVKTINNHLIVDRSGGDPFDLEISNGTVIAIAHEFQRDAANRYNDDSHGHWHVLQRPVIQRPVVQRPVPKPITDVPPEPNINSNPPASGSFGK